MATIHMIRSVKGGSGKTAFALHKVIALVKEKDDKGKFKNVLFLDADVHASETYTMMYNRFSEVDGKTDPNAPEGNYYFFDFFNGETQADNQEPREERIGQRTDKEAGHFLNTYIHPYKGFNSKLEEVMVAVNLKPLMASPAKSEKNPDQEVGEVNVNRCRFEFAKSDGNISGDIKFIFSDPSEDGRDVFGNIFQSSGRSAVGVGTYIAKMKNLIGYVLDKDSNFTDIVVDMPPGSDTFSEHLANLLIEIAGLDHSLNIYYVTSDDRGHMISSVNAATAHLHQMKNAYINSVCLVLNDGRDNNELFKNTKRDTIIKMLNWLVRANKEDDLNRLVYTLFTRDKAYYEAHRVAKNNKGYMVPGRPKAEPPIVIFKDNCIKKVDE